MDALGLPVRVLITQGTTHDVTQSESLIEDIDAEYLLADRVYDYNALIYKAIAQKATGKSSVHTTKHLYKFRSLVENAVLHLKRWRGIATRYAQNTDSFLAAIQIRCMMLWLQ